MTKKQRLPAICRYSIRTLFLIVTALCSLLVCWKLTKSNALREIAEHAHAQTDASFKGGLSGDPMWTAKPSSPMPFVIRVRQWDPGQIVNGKLLGGPKYYLWFFGIKLRLPFEGQPETFARQGRYTVVTVDGRVHSGWILRENKEEVVLRSYPDTDVRLPRKMIDFIQADK